MFFMSNAVEIQEEAPGAVETTRDPCAAPIKALAPWLGGKRSMADRIVAELGEHEVFIEPFMGGCSILPRKSRSPIEVCNDLHGDIVNLAKVVAHPELGRDLENILRLTPFAEHELQQAVDRIAGDPEPVIDDAERVERAADFLIVSWMGRSGEGGTSKSSVDPVFCVRWSDGGGNPAQRWRSVLRSIAHWRARLANVTFTNKDGFDVLETVRKAEQSVRLDRANGKPARHARRAIYIDPPYVGAGRQYLHTFEEIDDTLGLFGDDHERLRDACQEIEEARIVISYYDHPKIRELWHGLPGWTWIDCTKHKASAHASGGGAVSPEVLIVNGPSYTAQGGGAVHA